MGYENIKYNLTESSFTDMKFNDLKIDLSKLVVAYGDHAGHKGLRNLILENSGLKV